MIARSEAVASIPDALSPVEAAPILCAGITTFNSLRHSGAQAGDLVAVQGLGGALLSRALGLTLPLFFPSPLPDLPSRGSVD